jgi:hypothetical protein
MKAVAEVRAGVPVGESARKADLSMLRTESSPLETAPVVLTRYWTRVGDDALCDKRGAVDLRPAHKREEEIGPPVGWIAEVIVVIACEGLGAGNSSRVQRDQLCDRGMTESLEKTP